MTNKFLIRGSGEFQGLSKIITEIGENNDTGIELSIVKLNQDQEHIIDDQLEGALLIMSGQCQFQTQDKEGILERRDIFKESPQILSFAQGNWVKLMAKTQCELLLMRTANEQPFATKLFDQESILEDDHRGKGLLDDTAYRVVRTAFDKRNHERSNLVVGEVITFPGRWSSYPPHHHIQPEIYHYRFSEPQGYGHAELGDDVYKVKHGDTIKILDLNDHSQTSAPGYAMYYMWVIRHLPSEPYMVPVFTKEHEWTRSNDANDRVWK